MFDDLIKKISSLKNPFAAYKMTISEGANSLLVTHAADPSLLLEQYRNLREDLLALTAANHAKVIEVTSGRPGDGKTFVSCNLALTLAASAGKKILLIDGDLRKPDVHAVFGLPREPGLSDVISGHSDIMELIRKPAVENLYVVTSGSATANAAELLRQPKMKETISSLKGAFDYIVIDTPPVLPVSDSRIIGSLCDAVVVVVKSDVTPKDAVDETMRLLENAHIKPAGFVLTNYRIPIYELTKRKAYCEGYAAKA
jgi:capsular exopolysaccharide synthesis family protein